MRDRTTRGGPARAWAWVAVLAAAAWVAAACGGGAATPGQTAAYTLPEGSPSAPAVLSVATTLYPLEYFARRVGGDRVAVVNLVAAGVEAHDFEPTADAMRLLTAADVVVFNGAGFEPWLDRALAATNGTNAIVVEAADGLAVPSRGSDTMPDPHVWLDPTLASQEVERIRVALTYADPSGADVYQANAAELERELTALDDQFKGGLAVCERKQFVTAHDAFEYLARRYALEAVPVTGITPEAEPSAKDLARLADQLKATGVKYVMMEPGTSGRLAQTLAGEVGATVLTLHPLETLMPAEVQRGETYFTVMRANLANLRIAMGCGL